MTDKDFISLCKKVVVDYENEHLDKSDDKQITEDDVYVVWICKILQNNKALVSTTLFNGMYYEIIPFKINRDAAVDAYKKWENFVVK